MKHLIANWKMNPSTEEEAVEMAEDIEGNLAGYTGFSSVICPPFPYIHSVRSVLQNSNLGAQDMSPYKRGAYTGQVSAEQLKDLGVRYVIIGHSERRKYTHETLKDIGSKLRACVEHNLVPVLCLGSGLTASDDDAKIKSVLRAQMEEITHGIYIDSIFITYEPTWAISTSNSGRIPDREHVSEMVNFIRDLVDSNQIENSSVLYGGSINANNIKEFMSADGFLVGSASLHPQELKEMAAQISQT